MERLDQLCRSGKMESGVKVEGGQKITTGGKERMGCVLHGGGGGGGGGGAQPAKNLRRRGVKFFGPRKLFDPKIF